jgi:hypothetical protein
VTFELKFPGRENSENETGHVSSAKTGEVRIPFSSDCRLTSPRDHIHLTSSDLLP